MSGLSAIQEKRIDLRQSYLKYKKRKQLFVGILIPTLVVLVGIAVSTGSANISFTDIFGLQRSQAYEEN